MKQKQKQAASILLLVTQLLFPVFFPSCTDDAADGDRLPDGMYPMTFTTTVQGLTQTRATVDNTWTGGEEVAVKVGNEVKKYTAASSGALTLSDAGNPHYWTNRTMTVQAWHSATYSDTRPTNFTVQQDQNSDANYQNSDMLYAIQSVTYSSGSPVSLAFKHLPVKVVVNLKADTQNGITADEVTNATVTLMNQTLTSGAITVDESSQTCTVAQATGGSEVITPRKLTSAATDYQQTLQALLVPQQMKDTKFIKVTIGADAAARDYYYTPTTDADGKLEAGNQYTYDITVKKTGLAVTVQNNGMQWTDNSINGGDPVKKEYYKITFPATSTTGLSNIEVKDSKGQTISAETDGVSYHLSTDQSAFNISYTSANAMKSLVPVSGFAGFSRISNSNSDSFTANYTRVCSDITLSYDDYAEVGDYYYSDGTCGPGSTPPGGSGVTAIGVVFYTGVGPDDALSNYSSISGMTKIHGYVVAAKDLLNSANTSYGGKLPKNSYGYLQNFDVLEIENSNDRSYNGYAVTKIIREKYISKNTEYEFPAFAACATYGTDTQAAPANSSGWYLPSAAMLPAIDKIKSRCADCPDGSAPNGDYMSCSETDAYSVQGYAFHKSQYTGRSKNDDNTKARAVLTF